MVDISLRLKKKCMHGCLLISEKQSTKYNPTQIQINTKSKPTQIFYKISSIVPIVHFDQKLLLKISLDIKLLPKISLGQKIDFRHFYFERNLNKRFHFWPNIAFKYFFLHFSPVFLLFSC